MYIGEKKLVHEKHTIPPYHNRSSDSGNGDQSEPDFENSPSKCIEPEWKIDDDGIPYCTQQTEYEKIIATDLKKRFPFEFEKRLNCQHCNHYHQDNCYFPKSEIDKIEADRQNLKIRCELCGTKIDRPFSILMSYYYHEKYHVKMPIICCSCYSGLENGTFLKNSKKRSVIFFITLLISIYFLITFFLTIPQFSWSGLLLTIIPFGFWGYLSVRDLKNIYYLRKGRKFYNEIMNAEEAKSENDSVRRDKFLDDEDKKPPSDGAFDSPGYRY